MSIEKQLMEKYSVFQKKYSLPLFDDLNNNFGIVLIVDGKSEFVGHLLVAIRHKIVDTFQNWIHFLHSIYIPSLSYFPSLKQHEALSDEDKKELFFIISHLSLLTNKSLKISLYWENTDKDAEFIKEAFKEFMELRDRISYFVDKNILVWDSVLKQKT
ncbi:MAG: hypothetical protein U9O94_07890 [Nanoarchaeota archaeon]|nr:hypothetical protein [Nanoarchaeota archaeon]